MSEISFERKPSVYLCQGCGIGEAISVSDLESTITGEMNIANCKSHPALCSEEGVSLIAKDVKGGETTQAIIGACSQRVMADKFTFEGAQSVRANLREQVAWTQKPGEENTQMLATDQLRMAVAQCEKIEPPQAHWEGVSSVPVCWWSAAVSAA